MPITLWRFLKFQAVSAAMRGGKCIPMHDPNALIQTLDYRGTPALQLRTVQGDSAIVALYGAHLLSWVPAGASEQLYLSPLTPMRDGAAIRGGVPVIFPQFSARGTGMRHGFARIQPWKLLSQDVANGLSEVVLRLSEQDATLASWPHRFCCDLRIALQHQCLEIQFTVHNTGVQGMSFTAALHTYFEIGSLASVKLDGLQSLTYEDTGRAGFQEEALLQPRSALDRIYFDTPSLLSLESASGGLGLQSHGFTDTVVWNPGNAEMPDVPQADRDRFLCVEAALIGRPAQLAPGMQWQAGQRWTHTAKRLADLRS